MSLIKEYLSSIAGVYIFAVISLLIFFITFLFMVIHAYGLRKDEVRDFSHLPLDEDEQTEPDAKT